MRESFNGPSCTRPIRHDRAFTLKPVARSRNLFTIVTWVVFALGVVLRWFYIRQWHDPRKYVYSDMEMYVSLAKQMSRPGFVLTSWQVTHPPGNVWIVMYFLGRDPTLLQHVYFNFVVCALVPLAVGALGWVAFGRRAGEASVIVASTYFAFIDFGAYFLAEVHMTLVATLSIALYLYAAKLADRPPSAKRTVGFVVAAALGGVFFSLAMTLKMVALLAIGGFCLLHLVFTQCKRRLQRVFVLGVFVVSALPLTGFVAARCTRANDGHFCSGSNKSAADFLLGHYGRIGGIEWRDKTSGVVLGFGSPAASQHNYRTSEIVPFAITDQKSNNHEAWGWIGKHPFEALVLSVEHLWDAFGGSYPWPPNVTGVWVWSYAFHYGFLFLMIAPSLILLVDVFRARGVMGFLRSMELAVFSPILGLCFALFLATGEVRYRVPWDGVFIVLGVEFYRRIRWRLREPGADETPPIEKAGAETAAASPLSIPRSRPEPDERRAVTRKVH